MKIRINTYRRTGMIVLFLFLWERCFCLISEDTKIFGLISYFDIIFGVYFLYFLRYYLKKRHIQRIYKFKTEIFILLLCCFVAAVQQRVQTGQSIMLGLRPQRYYFLILMSYFPIRIMFREHKIRSEELLEALFWMGVVSAVLYMLQKCVPYQFIYVQTSLRNASLRMYIDSSIIGISTLIAVYKFSVSYRLKYAVGILTGAIYLVWISQGRLEIVAVLGASVLGLLLVKQVNVVKGMTIVAVAVGVVMFLSSEFAQLLIKHILELFTDVYTDGNNLEIRTLGKAMYMEQLTDSIETLLFGCGYPSKLYSAAYRKAGYTSRIYLNDNGVFGFFYIYGLLGLLALGKLFIKMLRGAWFMLKKKNAVVPFSYLVMIAIMAYNIIFWYWHPDGTMLLVLMMCWIEESEYENKIVSE